VSLSPDQLESLLFLVDSNWEDLSVRVLIAKGWSVFRIEIKELKHTPLAKTLTTDTTFPFFEAPQLLWSQITWNYHKKVKLIIPCVTIER